jgi:hypothetical protein
MLLWHVYSCQVTATATRMQAPLLPVSPHVASGVASRWRRCTISGELLSAKPDQTCRKQPLFTSLCCSNAGRWGARATPSPISQKWFKAAEPPVSRTLLKRILHFPAEQQLGQKGC